MNKAAIAVAISGISLASCIQNAPGTDSESEPENVGAAQQSIVTQCPYLDPGDPLFVSLSFPVDFASEIMITDVNVVDDPCRTTWSGSCSAGGSQGIWTFGHLIAEMAGTTPPEQFVAEWLHQWEIPLTINGFSVPSKANLRPLFLDPWLVASGCSAGDPIVGPGACTLDLKQAPFQLNAIVSRPDLECAGYTGKGDGEARFVFQFLDGGGNPLQAAVILEYKLPPQRHGSAYSAANWEKDWHQLSDPGLGGIGSPVYNKILENILDDITRSGVNPSGPNFGNSIGTVRTNEIDFGGFWALREARLEDIGLGTNAESLNFTTTSETPDDTLNVTGTLDSYLDSQAFVTGNPALNDFTQKPIPSSFAGGEASAPFMWDHTTPGTLTPIERHHFSFNTCNGCHTGETTTKFLHVSTRTTGTPSTLSPFLDPTGSFSGGPGLPPLATLVPDPAGTGNTFEYNEPWRRTCEATRMLGGHGACWSRGNGAH